MYNSYLNFLLANTFTIMWHFYVEQKDAKMKRLIIESILGFISVVSEISLMWFTTQNIDFRKYLTFMMKGWHKKYLLPHTSIFLKYRQIVLEESSMLLSNKESSQSHYPSQEGSKGLLQEDIDTIVNTQQEGWNLKDSEFTDRKDRVKYELNYWSTSETSNNISHP